MASKKIDELKNRKGAPRMSAIPADVMNALNRGEIETVNLVEVLAIDHKKLLGAAIKGTELEAQKKFILSEYDLIAGEGFAKRNKGAGEILFRALENTKKRAEAFEHLATHQSDVVRAWAAFTHLANIKLTLGKRLNLAKRFASDSNMNVREIAWDSFRPYLAIELDKGIKILEQWTFDSDENIRRCAVEGSRPCGVWTAHITELRDDPERAIKILEPVKSDESRYVQNAVGNWLNDASKYSPGWVIELCDRWSGESETPETKYITNRGLRTLRKKGKVKFDS